MAELDLDQAAFVERADYLDDEFIKSHNVHHPYLDKIQKELRGLGARLLRGPRGSGKTHQMKVCYLAALQRSQHPFPVYVSFNRYFRLEPLLGTAAHAKEIFHAWMLALIVSAAETTAQTLGTQDGSVPSLVDELGLASFVETAESARYDTNHERILREQTPSRVVRHIEDLLDKSDRRRVVLLLDDAALTLTPAYMVEFFEVFRTLKTRRVSPKASVYPGTTEYGPRFHVPHDATPIDCWLDPSSSEYLDFTSEVLAKRLPAASLSGLSPEVLRILQYASFGIPRALIVLVQAMSDSEAKSTQAKLNGVLRARKEYLLAEYSSLAAKMPQYDTLIGHGKSLFLNAVDAIKTSNREKPHTTIELGLPPTTDTKLNRMIRFLVEAGLLYPLGVVSHGSDRQYERYVPHLSILISENAFSRTRGFAAKEVVGTLRSDQSKHPLRRSYSTLLPNVALDQLELDLPPCQSCQEKRLTEHQKYCHSCGSKLIAESIYHRCLKIKLSDVPLPGTQSQRIAEFSNLDTISDLLALPQPATELRLIPTIGEKRAAGIILAVRRYVVEFLG